MVEISNAGLALIFAGTSISTFLLIAGWRIWRKYLAPPEALCGRWHTIKVNIFWIIITIILLSTNSFTLIYYNPEMWETIKEAFKVG